MIARRPPSALHPPRHQHGAALMVMLVILILGAVTIFVSALSSSAIPIARDKVTADALAKAKEALIGYAVSDSNRPGELPCPDFNNDGVVDITNDYSGSNCKNLIGWLPWKTLGLPELRDANGDHLWYAVANPFHANSSATLNSDTQTLYPTQMLTVIDGTTSATLESGVIAIVFSAGSVLSSETRSPNDNNATNAVQNYLEGKNAILNTVVFQTANDKLVPAPTLTVNDRLLTINYNALFPPVERRIARETKSCLDNYAASSSGKYPWVAPITDTAYQGAASTYFGRVPAWPVPSPDANVINFLSALTSLQSALTNYIASNSSTTRTALNNAGVALVYAAQTVAGNQPTSPAVSSATTTAAQNTGNQAQTLAQNPPATTVLNVQNLFASTISDLQQSLSDTSMQPIWPNGCIISFAPYWADWQSLLFYQVASGYQPGGSASCTVNTTCLTINGSGNTAAGNGSYRAAVLVARHPIPVGSPPALQVRNFSDPTTYLEGVNPHTILSTSFETYQQSDPQFQSVNDQVSCLDGNNNCK